MRKWKHMVKSTKGGYREKSGQSEGLETPKGGQPQAADLEMSAISAMGMSRDGTKSRELRKPLRMMR